MDGASLPPPQAATEFQSIGRKQRISICDAAGREVWSDAELWEMINAIFAILSNPGPQTSMGTLDAALGPYVISDGMRILMQAVGPTGFFDLLAAAGANGSLTNRLAIGDVNPTSWGLWNLRVTRRTVRQLTTSQSGDPSPEQLIINIYDDSYGQAAIRYTERFAKALQTALGMAGDGWTGFGYYSAYSGPYVNGGTQPTGVDGNARLDLLSLPVYSGSWQPTYNTPGLNTPSMSCIASSTGGDYVRWPYQAGHTAANLYYTGDGTGVVQVSWDDGATWSANINLATAAGAFIALAAPPGTAGNARIKVISGNVKIDGVEMVSTTAGVRVNKLAGSGATTAEFAGVTPATWCPVIANMAPNLQVFGVCLTNDQGASVTPAAAGTSFSTVLANLKTATPYADFLVTTPCENGRAVATSGSAMLYTMPQYTAVIRPLAVAAGVAFYDDQLQFGVAELNGVPAGGYNYGQAIGTPLLNSDFLHPNTLGGELMADARARIVLNGVAF